ncbi:MAG: amino acid permease [Bacteroidales bacterium]|nr:amino acid permease [Bacteroidales bacterium]
MLLVTLGYFMLEGFAAISLETGMHVNHVNFFEFTHGIGGFLGTVGFVFVSYIGLTKVSSVAEEIKNPERNIPLGMLLSLLVTSLVYILGVYIILKVVDLDALSTDLTPVGTAGKNFKLDTAKHWLHRNYSGSHCCICQHWQCRAHVGKQVSPGHVARQDIAFFLFAHWQV